MLSDLRDSGAIEQDADLVAFLHREDYFNQSKIKKSDEDAGFGEGDSAHGTKAEIIIAKQRNGPVGSVPLTFLADYMRFESYIDG
jgi:replicative DNA helicase